MKPEQLEFQPPRLPFQDILGILRISIVEEAEHVRRAGEGPGVGEGKAGMWEVQEVPCGSFHREINDHHSRTFDTIQNIMGAAESPPEILLLPPESGPKASVSLIAPGNPLGLEPWITGGWWPTGGLLVAYWWPTGGLLTSPRRIQPSRITEAPSRWSHQSP